MTIQELMDRLSDLDIIKIMESLGGEVYDENEKYIIWNTICHNGDSANKLYYFRDTKYFHCYTNCGQLSIFDIIKNIKDYELNESINYICTLLNISTMKVGFGLDDSNNISDWKFINKLKNRRKKVDIDNTLKVYDTKILNIFQDIYTSEWKDDGISEEVMKSYNIKYSTLQQKIIIPHYDLESNLVGIRCRAMLEEDIEEFGKYTPLRIYNTMYNHKLSQNLYGIHMNKECIKRKKKVMLVESEKGVLQSANMFGIDENFTLALCGKGINSYQRNMLLSLGVDEVIIALDRQYKEVNDEEYKLWVQHIQNKILSVVSPYFRTYVLWDLENMLSYKESPTDRDRGTLMHLMKNKIYIPS